MRRLIANFRRWTLNNRLRQVRADLEMLEQQRRSIHADLADGYAMVDAIKRDLRRIDLNTPTAGRGPAERIAA